MQHVQIRDYQVNAQLLKLHPTGQPVQETLHSHLLRSLCPVTGQPDWGSLRVTYHGPAIARDSLLKYLVSYRQHQAFHEQTVEQIFVDIQRCCQPQRLTVQARFLRRGGLEINPLRSDCDAWAEDCWPRLQRQ